jgi:glycosyltransferase involved in cell wall biosynthesis
MVGDLSLPQVTVGHSGRQHAYRLAAVLGRLGCLDRLATSGYYKPDVFPDRLIAGLPRLDTLLRRRHLDGLDTQRVIRRWDLEVPELLYRGFGRRGLLGELLVMIRDLRFDRWAARHWAPRSQVYWGFQGSCLHSLRAARSAGALAVAEFAAVHITSVRKIIAREAERHPEWADSMPALRLPSWYEHRLLEEPLAADYCVTACGFARRSLLDAGVARDRVEILPLGVDLAAFRPTSRSQSGAFRVLFVGKISQSKGVKYLLEAMRRLHSEQIELVLVGPLVGSGRALATYAGSCTCLGKAEQRRVVGEMQKSHLLVLPSLSEGFGFVIPEAMATGMPVIASTHSAGPEIIEEGVDGFILEPDDVDGLAGHIDWLASHRGEACAMGMAASRKAREFSWECFEQRLAQTLQNIWQRQGALAELTTRNALTGPLW